MTRKMTQHHANYLTQALVTLKSDEQIINGFMQVFPEIYRAEAESYLLKIYKGFRETYRKSPKADQIDDALKMLSLQAALMQDTYSKHKVFSLDEKVLCIKVLRNLTKSLNKLL